MSSWENESTSPPSRPLDWDDLDKKKYYLFGPLLFLGVRAAVYPSNLVKTRLQVQVKNSDYNGTFDAFRKIVKREGVKGLYKGFFSNSLSLISGNIYITVYEVTRKAILTANQQSANMANFIGGACASLISQTIVVPLDVVSQKLMVSGSLRNSSATREVTGNALDVCRSIIRKHGLRGFYRGYLASIATHTPSSAIWWSSYGGAYPHVYDLVSDRIMEKNRTILSQAISGGIAGMVSAFITNPMDVVRTRTQVSGDSTAMETLRHLVKEEGVQSLMNGASARILAMGPSGVLVISTYELVKRLSKKEEIDDNAQQASS